MSARIKGTCVLVTVLVLAAGTAWGASYTELAAKAKASLKAAGPAGFKPAKVETPKDLFKPAYGYPQLGGVLFFPDMAAPLLDRPPTNQDLLRRPRVFLAQGETSSLLVADYALRAAKAVRLAARLVDRAGSEAAGISVEIKPVVFAPVANKRSKTYVVQGLWLADDGPVPVEPNHLVAWVVRLKASSDAKPGEYQLKLSVSGAAAKADVKLKDQLLVTVLPFRLADPAARGYTFGAFCAGANFSEAQFRQMKEHGIEAILWFWGHYGLDVINDNGKLRMDFTDLDKAVKRFQKAGLRGPIVLALGNDSAGHFERAICEAFNLPMQPRVKRNKKVVKLAVLDDPRIEELMVEALRQLFEHAKKMNWPEIVILPYDEPTERLMKEHRRMVKLFRRHFPDVRLYGVTMDRLEWAKQLLDTDILVCNGDWVRIRRLAREHNKSVWFYGSVTAGRGYASCRLRYGLSKYVYRPDGTWFWSYNFDVADPWNEFDGHTPDSSWIICWEPLRKDEASVGTLGYEGLRDGVNDVRYAMTLEEILKKTKSPVAAEVRKAYETWRKACQAKRPKPAELPKIREQLVRWILRVLDKPMPYGL